MCVCVCVFVCERVCVCGSKPVALEVAVTKTVLILCILDQAQDCAAEEKKKPGQNQ